MRMRSLQKYLMAAALLVTVTVHADTPAPSDPAPPAPAPASPTNGATVSGSVSGTVSGSVSGSGSGSASGTGTGSGSASGLATGSATVNVKLSPSEMTVRAKALEIQVTDDVQHVQRLEAQARKQQDVIKLACVNDKLVAMKAKLNIFDTTRVQFDASIGTGADPARASFVELSTTGSDLAVLRQEADRCAGVPELQKQESGVEVMHPDFPDDPTTEQPAFNVDVEPPAYASPFA